MHLFANPCVEKHSNVCWKHFYEAVARGEKVHVEVDEYNWNYEYECGLCRSEEADRQAKARTVLKTPPETVDPRSKDIVLETPPETLKIVVDVLSGWINRGNGTSVELLKLARFLTKARNALEVYTQPEKTVNEH